MKNYILILIFFFTTVSWSQYELPDTNAYEHVVLFDATYDIQKDCSMEITETIRVYAGGNEIKRGIYREIPLIYKYMGGVTTVDFELISLTRDSKKEAFHTENMDNGIRIYFGSEDVFLTKGYYTYELKYRVNHVLRFLDETDDLYWNVNGTGWSFSIDTIRAHVKLPEGISFTNFRGYSGKQGETFGDYEATRIAENELLFVTSRPYEAGENLTFSASWPKNKLDYPTGTEEFMYWIKSHALAVFLIIVLIILFSRSYVTWYKFGRDPLPGTIMPQYDPPAGFSASELRAIDKRGNVDGTALTAELISIAAKGWMDITCDDSERKTAYTFNKLEGSGHLALNDIQQELRTRIFANRDSFYFKKGSYSPTMKSLLESLTAKIQEKHGETYRKYNTDRNIRQYSYLLLAVIGAFVVWYFFGGHVGLIYGFAGLNVIYFIVFGYLFQQPTKKGRALMDHISGMKLFIQYADQERIKFNNPPTMDFDFFERMLPYAIALDLAKEWQDQFAPEIITEGFASYGWYNSTTGIHSFSSTSFSSLSSSVASSSTPPSSSGGGSFSGGGGSSGGGGGGGGGGGW